MPSVVSLRGAAGEENLELQGRARFGHQDVYWNFQKKIARAHRFGVRDILPLGQTPDMKIVRVPWIRCRADEVGSTSIEVKWRKQTFLLLAYTEREAQEWWGGLREEERDEALGLDTVTETEQSSFW